MSQPIRIRTLCTGHLRALLPSTVSLAALLGCSGDIVNLGEDASPRPKPPSYSRCVDSPTLVDDVHVGQQSELDALEGCETIQGDLYVQPYFLPDLRPLHELKVVTGTLALGSVAVVDADEQDAVDWEFVWSVFRSGGWLVSLEGLEALESAGSLEIGEAHAPDLEPLSGLRALTGEGALGVSGENLRDLAPLRRLQGIRSLGVSGRQLESIADLQVPTALGWLSLSGEQLTELGSIRQVRTVVGSVYLSELALRDLTPFSALQSVAELAVLNLPLLKNLDGLEQLTEGGRSVSISGNPRLDNIDGLAMLRHVDWLDISRNASLRQIPDFPRLPELKRLEIYDNPALEQISEFSGIGAHMAALRLDPTRVRQPGVPDFTSTTFFRPDAIGIVNNPLLRSLSLPGWVGGEFVQISHNASLETLDLANLESIDDLRILSNPALHRVDLRFLVNIDSLSVTDNPQLSPSTFDGVQTIKRDLSGNAGMPSDP